VVAYQAATRRAKGRIRAISGVVVVCLPPLGGTMRLHLVTVEAWIAPLAAWLPGG
jgi:hypothetical protein